MKNVDTANLKAIAAGASDTAKTNALLNAAREIDRLRATECGYNIPLSTGDRIYVARTAAVELIEAARILDAKGFFDDVPYSPNADLVRMKAALARVGGAA